MQFYLLLLQYIILHDILKSTLHYYLTTHYQQNERHVVQGMSLRAEAARSKVTNQSAKQPSLARRHPRVHWSISSRLPSLN